MSGPWTICWGDNYYVEVVPAASVPSSAELNGSWPTEAEAINSALAALEERRRAIAVTHRRLRRRERTLERLATPSPTPAGLGEDLGSGRLAPSRGDPTEPATPQAGLSVADGGAK